MPVIYKIYIKDWTRTFPLVPILYIIPKILTKKYIRTLACNMVALKSTVFLAWASSALAGHAWNSTSTYAHPTTKHHHPSGGFTSPYPSHSHYYGNGTYSHKPHGTGVQTTKTTSYFTTTLPNGSVSTGTVIGPVTGTATSSTSTAPLLSNNAAGREAQGIIGLVAAGLLALI